MLIALVVWFTVIPAAWGYGRLLLGKRSDSSVESVVFRLYAGILLMAALLFALAIFRDLAWWLGVVILIPGFSVALTNRVPRNNRRAIAACAALMVPIALWVTSREIRFYDTALYHQPVVRWLSEYGLVRGIGLICFRFALVSSWFAAAAPLNQGGLDGRAA